MMSITSFSASFSSSFSPNFPTNFSHDVTKDLSDHYGGGELKNDQEIGGIDHLEHLSNGAKANESDDGLQIDFSYLSNSGKGDLFVEYIETDETQPIETDETLPKWLSNHTENADDVNKSMAVVAPCSSPSLSPNSRACAA